MRYLDLITASFVAVLLISNIAALKVFQLGPLVFDGGAFIFPISYIFGDILTEVYGFKQARRVIWIGFFWLIAMNVVLAITVAMPPEPSWAPNQQAFQQILGISPRIALAGIVGYFWGEFANSYVLARMKVYQQGKHLWMRTIGSTVVGELVDTALFCLIAFGGILPASTIVNYTLTGYLYKTAVEVLFTPVTYAIVNFLKKTERQDAYDTEFSLF